MVIVIVVLYASLHTRISGNDRDPDTREKSCFSYLVTWVRVLCTCSPTSPQKIGDREKADARSSRQRLRAHSTLTIRLLRSLHARLASVSTSSSLSRTGTHLFHHVVHPAQVPCKRHESASRHKHSGVKHLRPSSGVFCPFPLRLSFHPLSLFPSLAVCVLALDHLIENA